MLKSFRLNARSHFTISSSDKFKNTCKNHIKQLKFHRNDFIYAWDTYLLLVAQRRVPVREGSLLFFYFFGQKTCEQHVSMKMYNSHNHNNSNTTFGLVRIMVTACIVRIIISVFNINFFKTMT